MPDKDLSFFTDIAQYIEQPRLPGVEKKLNAWLEANPDNRLEWQKWQRLTDKARRLHSEPLDVDDGWGQLRDSIGLRRQKARPKSEGKERVSRLRFASKPLLFSLAAMAALSAFFFLLYFIRLKIGF